MEKVKLLSVLFAITVSLTAAQTEFFVNSTFPSVQRDPQIARDSSGNYAVAWKSEYQIDTSSKGDIYLQFFNAKDQPIGTETIVNTITANDQDKPAIAMNAGGDLVVTWASYSGFNEIYDIKARIFKNRAPTGNEFLVNTTTKNTQTHPAAAIDPSGTFVIAWDSWDQDGSDKGIFAQQFSGSGTKLGGEFQINVTTQYSQAKPAIRFFPNGKFIVVWESWKQDQSTPPGYGIYGRIFDNSRVPVTNEFPVNTFVNDYQWYADVETFSDNSFTVVWCSWEQDGSDGGIYFQRFNANAVKTGAETPVNQTTGDYQWLPKIKSLADNSFAVLWSSWKQDGDREGVYLRIFDQNGVPKCFETKVNDYTQNFQWEPDLICMPSKDMVVVWSCWGKAGKDYDVVAKRFSPTYHHGYFNPSAYEHVAGISTSKFIVHRIDSSKITGHQYELRFDSLAPSSFTAKIIDRTDGDTVVSNFVVNRGEKYFYVTEPFDGVAVEIKPELDLDLDYANSYVVNSSGTNAILTVASPTAGVKLLAPIDVVLIWGNSDTTAGGQFVTPSDTALSISGQRVVTVPFSVWNLSDKSKMDLLVVEGNSNKRFDFGERIIFLTPAKYRKAANNSHAQITNSLPAPNGKWPSKGDSIFVLTTRPLSAADRFRFTTNQSTLVHAAPQNISASRYFELDQNFPNPFNPTTAIKYRLDQTGKVRLSIYNVLGQRVKVLIDEIQEAGSYRHSFEASHLAAGVYFYMLEMNNRMITKKMILLK
jgi:hypothetical protein